MRVILAVPARETNGEVSRAPFAGALRIATVGGTVSACETVLLPGAEATPGPGSSATTTLFEDRAFGVRLTALTARKAFTRPYANAAS